MYFKQEKINVLSDISKAFSVRVSKYLLYWLKRKLFLKNVLYNYKNEFSHIQLSDL